MIKIKNIKIHQYKSIETELNLRVKSDITVLMGKNEAGKTNILEAIAKTNYFNRDAKDFYYDPLSDYPRCKKKELDRQKTTPVAVTATYQVSEKLLEQIQKDVILEAKSCEFSRITDYKGNNRIIENGFEYDLYDFWETYVSRKEPCLKKYIKYFVSLRTQEAFREFCKKDAQDSSKEEKEALGRIEKFFQNLHGWANPINEYVYRRYLLPDIPKYMYYDECYMLPSRISLDRLKEETELTPQERTAKAFLMLADIDLDNVVQNDSPENYKSELEAAQSEVNKELLKYWSANPDLRVEFEIIREPVKDTEPKKSGFFHLRRKKAEPKYVTWLEIRIKDIKNMVSLPLENRSRGFNWFFLS